MRVTWGKAAFCGFLVIVAPFVSAGAAESNGKAVAGALQVAPDAPDVIDVKVKRTWKGAGRSFEYMVEAREMGVGEGQSGAVATIFSFTYLRADVNNPRARPVMFFMNGGPGAAAALLHLGGFGPKRVPHTQRGEWAVDGLEDNPHTLLDVADLVFVDPVGTGFSRLLTESKAENYYGIDGDARSVAEFIRQWLDEHRRWTSPKYFVGESYGSFRAPLVADALTGGIAHSQWRGIQLDGVILIGTVLDLTQISENPANDLQFMLRIPTMAAIAWRYKKAGVDEELPTFVQSARDFANDIYLPALNRGDAISPEQRAAVARQLAQFTGLSSELVLARNLRISSSDFTRELLAERGLIVGAYDGRDTIPARTSKGISSIADPGSAAHAAQLSVALNDYIRRDLAIVARRSYDEVNYSLAGQWRWAGAIAGSYWNSAPALTDLMAQNPKLRVLVLGGYYDLATPFFGAERSLSHAGLPRERVHFRYYQSGHASYIGEESLRQAAGDLRTFVREANDSGKRGE